MAYDILNIARFHNLVSHSHSQAGYYAEAMGICEHENFWKFACIDVSCHKTFKTNFRFRHIWSRDNIWRTRVYFIPVYFSIIARWCRSAYCRLLVIHTSPQHGKTLTASDSGGMHVENILLGNWAAVCLNQIGLMPKGLDVRKDVVMGYPWGDRLVKDVREDMHILCLARLINHHCLFWYVLIAIKSSAHTLIFIGTLWFARHVHDQWKFT